MPENGGTANRPTLTEGRESCAMACACHENQQRSDILKAKDDCVSTDGIVSQEGPPPREQQDHMHRIRARGNCLVANGIIGNRFAHTDMGYDPALAMSSAVHFETPL